jgi:SAM-dependent methyltransferase
MDNQAEWWRTFFSGPVVDFWLSATTAEQTRQEAGFVREVLGVAPPARLLDVPCGGGRHCHVLAGFGYDMTGVDISPGFLDAARSRPAEGPGTIAWEQREMRRLPWAEEFDGAFSLGNSFGYDDDDGNADFLKSVARALKPGARFVLETSYLVEVLLPILQERGWYQYGETFVLSLRRYDHVEGRLHVEYTWIGDGRTEKRPMSARIYSFREVRLLLEEAGFDDVEGFSSFGRDPFRLGSPRLLMTATKARR